MTDLLDLKEFEVLQHFRNDELKQHRFIVQAKEALLICPICGCFDENGAIFKKHDTRPRTVSDIEIRGYKVSLEIRQRRFYCSQCEERFTEVFESIERDAKITKRLYEYIGKQGLQDNFLKVAAWHGVSDATVKKSFLNEVAKLDAVRVLVAPACLGIDEIYLHVEGLKRKQPYAIFTDIVNKRVLELVRGNTKEIVINVLNEMKGIEDVKVVSMDMASAYRNAVLECCPRAYTVVDHFHVIQKFGMALNVMRNKIQTDLVDGEKKPLYSIKGLITSNREDLDKNALLKLDTELKKYPRLKALYESKEGLRKVYKCTTKYDAFQVYYKWEQTITKDMAEAISLQRMINKLKKEIFNYFDDRYTNAYTECANGLIRRIMHDGNGYGFEVLRGKVLYGTPASKQKRVKIKDMNFYEVMFSKLNAPEDEKPVYIQYGERYVTTFYTDIEELMVCIDKGLF